MQYKARNEQKNKEIEVKKRKNAKNGRRPKICKKNGNCESEEWLVRGE